MNYNVLRYGIAAIIAIVAVALSASQGLAQQSPTTPVPQPNVPGVGDTTDPPLNDQTTQTSSDTVEGSLNLTGGAGAVSSGARLGQSANASGGGEAPAGGAPAVGFGGAATATPRNTRVLSSPEPIGLRVTTRSESGSHEPYLDRDVEFGDVPQGGEPMSMSSYDDGEAMPLLTFLDELHRATGWNIIPSPGLQNRFVRFWIENMTPQQALEVLRIHDIFYEYDAETKFLYVRGVDEEKRDRYGEILDAEFELNHADILDMETLLKNLASPRGRVVAEPRTGRLFVWDTEDNIEEMRELVKKLDIPVDPQTFTLNHANVLDIEESIPEFLSERGVAFTDPRTNSITITDQPERVYELAMFIEEIDKPLETRTWKINYADPEEIAARLEAYVPEEMSPIGLDEQLNQISVTSVPGRLDEIDNLIAQWDVKRRQVEIEAYLVATTAAVMRNMGVSWFYFDEKNGNNISVGNGETPIDFSRTSPGQLFQIGAVPFQLPRLVADPANPGAFIPELDINGNPIARSGFGNEGLSIALELLDRTDDLSILSRPRVTVMDGEEALFENTEDEPFQESGFFDLGNNNNNNRANNVVPLRVQFITVGTILKVVPRISDDNNIQMEISAEESSAETVEIVSGDLVSTIPKKRQSKTEDAHHGPQSTDDSHRWTTCAKP